MCANDMCMLCVSSSGSDLCLVTVWLWFAQHSSVDASAWVSSLFPVPIPHTIPYYLLLFFFSMMVAVCIPCSSAFFVPNLIVSMVLSSSLPVLLLSLVSQPSVPSLGLFGWTGSRHLPVVIVLPTRYYSHHSCAEWWVHSLLPEKHACQSPCVWCGSGYSGGSCMYYFAGGNFIIIIT